mgnify:CR=1 FL=1|tara:strand:+ start:53 stop:397 length:345 start_codon:yes stop_codon:yes gene_type:complete
MKIKSIVFAIVFSAFVAATVSWAGGITGGTTRNTTDRQHEQTSGTKQHTGGYKTPSWASKIGKKVMNAKAPVTAVTEKLIKGMKWSADKQRNLGGVPPTGDTVRANNERINRGN